MVICAPAHPLAKLKTVAPQAARCAYPYVQPRDRARARASSPTSTSAKCGIAPDDLNVVMELGSPEAMKGVVETGLGVRDRVASDDGEGAEARRPRRDSARAAADPHALARAPEGEVPLAPGDHVRRVRQEASRRTRRLEAAYDVRNLDGDAASDPLPSFDAVCVPRNLRACARACAALARLRGRQGERLRPRARARRPRARRCRRLRAARARRRQCGCAMREYVKPILLLEGLFEADDLQVVGEHGLAIVVHDDEQIAMLEAARLPRTRTGVPQDEHGHEPARFRARALPAGVRAARALARRPRASR